ncbi:hypothetical protein [Sphingomonas koreensis]
MKRKSIMAAFASMAAFAATTAHATQTAERVCLTQPELQALIASIMPDVVRGVSTVCRPALPAGAYLQKNGDALIAAFDAEARGTSDAARAAFMKFASMKGEAGANLSAEMLANMKREIGVELANGIQTRDCLAIDRLLLHMAPLSPANLAGAIGAIGTIIESDEAGKPSGGKPSKKKKSGFPPICPITID